MSTLLLIDLDGTLIDTPHFEAWRNAAREFGGKQLTQQEYIDHIAGRPRLEGATRLQALTQQDLGPQVAQAFSPIELADFKQAEFQRLSPATELFDDALRLLERIEDSDLTVRFYTASRNAPQLFDAALTRSDVLTGGRAPVVQQAAGQTRDELIRQMVGRHPPHDVHLIDDSPYAADLACDLGINVWQIRRHPNEPAANDPRASILTSLDEFTLPAQTTGKV